MAKLCRSRHGKVRGKHRLDKFYHLSKEVGYRSRAAFKLIQLDAKYSFLPGAHAVLDLCAAPGSWMQVVVQRIPVGSLVVGVDLVEIKPVRGAFAVQEDITHSKCRSTVKRLLSDNHVDAFDVVLHDGSPKLGGAWTQSATSQNALVIDSLKLATEFLAPKGTFVTKIFRSQDYNKVLFCLRQLFEKVEVTKPAGSRSTSAEIFIVCRKYKAPAKIDPRLLDIKHLFKEAIEPEKAIDVLRDSKQKRSRGGYKDDLSLVRKDCFAADFVWSENPLELLGTATVISFNDPDSLPIKDHELTAEEIEALCDDLGVLGKKDFKQLLKWRVNIRKALSSSKEPTSTSVKSVNEPKDDEGEVDGDEKILNEMEDLTHTMEVKKKREKKILAKRRAKGIARKALGKQIDATEDGYVDEELFSLASIKGKKDLLTVDDVTEDADYEVDFSKSERNSEGSDDDLSSDLDSDYERMRYDNKLEMLLDEAYERVVGRREGSTMQRKRAKRAYEDAELSDVEADMNLDDSDKDEEDTEANPLVVPMNDQPPSEEETAATWFARDIFSGVVDDEDLLCLKPGKDDGMQIDDQQDVKGRVSLRNKPEEKSMLKQSHEVKVPQKASKTEEDYFETVPAPATDSSDDDESDYDNDTKAEIVACAKKMPRKRLVELMLEDAYNTYMFPDDYGLPNWFMEDEESSLWLQKLLTKEEVDAIKAQLREIHALPMKKLAAMRQMEKIRKKANTISDQNDLPDRSKRRMYDKAAPQRPKKVLQVRAGKGIVLVNRRMKSDARQQGKNSSKGKKGKRKR